MHFDTTAFLRLDAPGSLGTSAAGASFATSTGDILEASCYGPGVFRLRVGPNTRPDYGLVQGRGKACTVTVAQRRHHACRSATARSRSPAGRCRSGCCTRARRCWARSPTSTSAAGRGCRHSAALRQGGRWTAAFALASGEPVYGLGEKFGPLDKRGQLIHSQVEDALGVNTGLAYKNTPFAWSTGTGRGAWGASSTRPATSRTASATRLVAPQLRHGRRRRGARPVPVRRRHAGGAARRLHAAHRPRAGPAAVEPRAVGVAGVLQDPRGGDRGRGHAARAADSLRRHHPRRPRGVEGGDAVQLPVGPGPVRRRALVARRAEGAPPPGLRLGVSVRVGARPAVRRARRARLPAKNAAGDPLVFGWDTTPGPARSATC